MRKMHCGAVLFLLCGTVLFADNTQPQDSLTASLCNNQEQIVARRVTEWRIAYFMGETELNMKTLQGFLSLNSASIPLYRRYRLSKIASWTMFLGGIGCIIADGKIKKPDLPLISLGGAALSVGGIVIGLRNNHTFRLAIHAYNKDICKIK